MPPAEPQNPNPLETPNPQPSAPVDPLHPEVVQQAQATPGMVMPSPQVAPHVSPGSPVPTPAKRRVNLSVKSLVIAGAAVLIVGGGTALAYVGVVIPNKPENILKSAIQHSLQSKGGSFSGSFEGEAATGSGPAYKATFNGGANATSKTADFALNLTISGATFPVETRLVNDNAYFKVGDLSSLSSLITAFSPDAAPVVQKLSSQVSNKWFVVDSTLLKEGGASCFLDSDWTLSPADQKVLQNAYGKQPFVTITSSSSDTIKGKKVAKLELSLDDDKMAAYAKNVGGQLSFVKKLQSCTKGSNPTSDTSSVADHDKTPLTLWIDKGTHQIVRFAGHSTAQDAKKANAKVTVSVDLDSTLPTITAPSGAEPITTLISSIEQSLGLGGSGDLSSLFGGGAGQ